MPNHITTIIRRHDAKRIDDIIPIITSDEVVDFTTLIPMQKELDGTSAPSVVVPDSEIEQALKEHDARIGRPISESEHNLFMAKYGCDNWYDWSIANWGTKWNAYDSEITPNDITFDTAWSHPLPFIIALSRRFPSTVFYVEYADEDIGSNCGFYTMLNGIITSEADQTDLNNPQEFACSVKGYDYEEYCKDSQG